MDQSRRAAAAAERRTERAVRYAKWRYGSDLERAPLQIAACSPESRPACSLRRLPVRKVAAQSRASRPPRSALSSRDPQARRARSVTTADCHPDENAALTDPPRFDARG